MGRIFLSYARGDRAFAEVLARVLEEAGHDLWWDHRIDGGEEFAAEIEAALARSDVVLVAWSKQSVKSRWVRDEAAVGGDTGRLVPVSIDATLPPMGFRQFHTLDLAGWKGGARDRRTAELLHSIERRLNDKEKGKAPPEAVTQRRHGALEWTKGARLWSGAAAVALAVAVGAALFFLNEHGATRGPAANPTIAMLPFTTASADPQLRDLAAQARDSVAHMLPDAGIPVRVLNALPENRGSAGDFVLSGELSRNGDLVIANLRLDEATQGVTVSSKRIVARADEVRDLPDRIGAQMAAYFDGWTLLVLDRRHPLEPSLIAQLLGGSDDDLQHLQKVKRVAAQHPDVAATQIGLAFETGLSLGQLPRDQRAEAVAEGRRAADRALALAPDFGNTYATWCLLHSETRMIECEDQLRTGNRVDPDATYINLFLTRPLRNVGRFADATDAARLSYSHDPYHRVKIAELLRMLEFSGDHEDARDLYQHGSRWWPGIKDYLFRNRLFGLIDRGDFDAMQRLEQEVSADALPPNYVKSSTIVAALQAKSRPALRRACAGEDFYIEVRCIVAFAKLGDEDGAYAIADRLYPRRVGRTPAETERIWLDEPNGAGPLEFVTSPAAAAMRRDPRYLDLAQRTGLLAYWRSGRTPDFCRKQPEPVCRQLLKRS